MTVESFKEFTGDLGFIEGASTDDETAIAQRFVIGAATNREQPDPRVAGDASLLGQPTTDVVN